MKRVLMIATALISGSVLAVPYPVVDTGQMQAYDTRHAIAYPKAGAVYYGQDAQYVAYAPSYKVNADGTVLDQVTGLMWQQDPGAKRTFDQAVAGAAICRTAGYTDWRLPTIKELYSLIQLNGTDPDPMGTDTSGLTPFIDASVFNFSYGQMADGDRIIDSQYASSTKYVSTTMGGNETMFGVNFADGRIKGYPTASRRGGDKTFYVLYVRGNPDYGINQFSANGDGTITDAATGLTWMTADSCGMDWPTALAYAEGMEFAGHSDWRLPDAKELQSIIDYSRSPDTTGSAAIDPLFEATEIMNEAGQSDYAHYWTSSSHVGTGGADAATYFAFGRAMGCMRGEWMDVHGAGAQRSDPKVGDASRYPTGRGPQGDAIRIDNLVRLVRGGAVQHVTSGPAVKTQAVAAPPAKQDRMQSSRGKMERPSTGFMQRADRDGDGKVSKAEFRGPDNHFDRFDKNGDGYITEEEAPTGPPPSQN